jgi:prolyl oligopeptidase
MHIVNSLRPTFSRVHGKKTATNDNATPSDPLARALLPPHDDTREVLHGVTIEDPFRPLENLETPETAAWVTRENKKFDDFMQTSKDVEADALSFLEKAVPQGKRETMPEKCADKYIAWRQEQGAVRQSLYLKDTPDFNDAGRLLLDPMKIDPSGKTNIVGAHFTHDGTMLAYRLSVSGSDKETLRFMDVATGEDIDLVYTKFRSAVNWDRDGKGFHYNYNDEATKSSEVRYHRMGTPIEDDKVIYAPDAPETSGWYFRLLKDSKDELGNHEWLSISNTAPDKNALLVRSAGSGEEFREIFPHKEGTLSPIAEIGGKIYATTSLRAPNEKLICFDVNDPAPEKWQTILPENNEDLLTGAFIWQNKIFATYRHDTGDVLKIFDLAGKHLHDAPMPPLSTFSMGGVEMDDPTCLIKYNNFQEAGNIYKYDSATNELTLDRKSSMPIDLKDCIVERISATSKDGTQVPMTVIRSPDTKLDGTAATILYGYGGFNVPLEPGFSASIAQWVRAGGIYVQANLRGGGEYGQKWYDDGRKENKQHVFDDFAACGEHLIKNNYTSSKRLAIQGGSNGGLLTLATMIQRPELFGAIVSEVPVADMFRFHIGSYYGFGWKSDYGDPGIEEDFNVAAKYSPLHNVKKGFKHPPLLIKTDANDDRVLPWHSYKMAATLQSMEDPASLTLLKIRTDGGHSAGMTEAQRRADIASVRAFLALTLGPISQNEYKAVLAKENSLARRVAKKFGRA